MKTPHPHAALIIEWAQDTSRKVQYRLRDKWKNCEPEPSWNTGIEYRFAPEPVTVCFKALPTAGYVVHAGSGLENLRLTFSADGPGKLLTAEVLK